MKYRSPILSYLKAGYLLHIITIAEIVIFIVLYDLLKIERWLAGEYQLLKSISLVPFMLMPVFAQLDARSRYQNYKQIKDQMFCYGFKYRILKPVLKSRCQRDAARAAAEELGFGKECHKYFYDNGYRWYHLLPDFVFKKPKFIFTWYFWSSTFLMPRYVSRYDFRTMSGHCPLCNSGIRV